MITYEARPVLQPQTLAAPAAGRRMARGLFVAQAVRQDRAAGFTVEPVGEAGLVRNGRPYVALECFCGHAPCPGWVLVHDDPFARAHFTKLFGRPRP